MSHHVSAVQSDHTIDHNNHRRNYFYPLKTHYVQWVAFRTLPLQLQHLCFQPDFTCVICRRTPWTFTEFHESACGMIMNVSALSTCCEFKWGLLTCAYSSVDLYWYHLHFLSSACLFLFYDTIIDIFGIFHNMDILFQHQNQIIMFSTLQNVILLIKPASIVVSSIYSLHIFYWRLRANRHCLDSYVFIFMYSPLWNKICMWKKRYE